MTTPQDLAENVCCSHCREIVEVDAAKLVNDTLRQAAGRIREQAERWGPDYFEANQAADMIDPDTAGTIIQCFDTIRITMTEEEVIE